MSSVQFAEEPYVRNNIWKLLKLKMIKLENYYFRVCKVERKRRRNIKDRAKIFWT